MPPARQILLQETTDAPIRRRLEAFCHSQHHEMAELESRHTVFEFTGHSAGITEFVRQVQFQIRIQWRICGRNVPSASRT